MNRPAIIVHGGAWHIVDKDMVAFKDVCSRAASEGWRILSSGGPALDAAEAAVRILEDDPITDAGRGSWLTKDGSVQLDAILMDGRTLAFGAVAAVERIRHPITLARRVMEQCEHSFVTGPGATTLAQELGEPLCDPADLMGRVDIGGWAPPGKQPAKSGAALQPPIGDTVGAVALDLAGHLAVATSTGGTPDKWPGRVGDSPLVGCGAYADDLAGAAAATGSGESLMRIVTSKTAVDLMAGGLHAQEAADAVIALLWKRVRGYGGVIAVDPTGNIGLAHNTPNLSYAYVTADGDLKVGVVASRDTPGRAAGLSAIHT